MDCDDRITNNKSQLQKLRHDRSGPIKNLPMPAFTYFPEDDYSSSSGPVTLSLSPVINNTYHHCFGLLAFLPLYHDVHLFSPRPLKKHRTDTILSWS
jgi:hypothetical protein